MLPWGIVWRIVFSHVHSQMNPQTWTEFGANRSIRLAAFPDLNLWPPKTPRNAPFEGRIVFSYVHSQTNPQTSTIFCVNRESRLTASPDIWICDPLEPSKMPLGLLWGDLHLTYVHSQMNPQTWTRVGANQSSRLTAPPDVWMFDPLKPPGILRGELYLTYVHSQTNPQICTNFGANRSSCLTASPNIWICDPLKPPGILRGELYLAYVHSQTNPPTGRLGFSLCPFPDESADVN